MSRIQRAILSLVASVCVCGCGGIRGLDRHVPAGGPVVEVSDLPGTISSFEDVYDWLEGDARVLFVSALSCNSMSVGQLERFSGKTASEIVAVLDEAPYRESARIMTGLYLGVRREKGESYLRHEVSVLVRRAFTMNLPMPSD